MLNSHIDTVPPNGQWKYDPYCATVVGDRIYGLGSNDTKGSVAAMMMAFQQLSKESVGGVGIMLVAEEETGGEGTEIAWPYAQKQLGWNPDAILVGEPTNMNIGSSQSGLIIVDLISHGVASHAAHPIDNPIFGLAHDLIVMQDLGGQPTVLNGSSARNQIPNSASAVIDFRTDPGINHEDFIASLKDRVKSEIQIRSSRLEPFACPSESQVVQGVQRALPKSQIFHSRTMSDLVYFQGQNAVKIGPGDTKRSHTTDEFIFVHEVIEGAMGYLAIAKEILN